MKYGEKLIFIHIFILGLAFTFLVPPLQKPDEHAHFKRAYYLSRGYVYIFNDGKVLPFDRQLNDLINDRKLNSLPYHPEKKYVLPGFTKPVFAAKNAFKPVFQKEKLMFIWGPVPYIPQAVGIFIARQLHLNAYLTFYAGRFAIFLFSFFALVWMCRRTRKPYRYLLLVVFSLPMTIHQLSAYSYDAVHYLFGFLLFSLSTDLLYAKKITPKDLFIFGAATVGFMISKLSYEPMLLLILLFPWKKIAENKWKYLRIMTFWIIAVIACYFALAYPTFLSSLSYSSHPPGVNPSLQLQFIATHIPRYLQILVTSTLALSKFHLQGVIGIFGWLDYSLDVWMYGVYFILAVYCIYKSEVPPSERLSKAKIGILAGILVLNYTFIMTVFYLNWKQIGAPMIDGTQGRYFTAFIPFILYCIVQLKYKIRKIKQ